MIACLLVACGGGGGSGSGGEGGTGGNSGGGSPPQPPPVPNQSPRAIIAATPTAGWAPLVVSFDGSPSSDPDGTIVAYRWDFGDGSPLVAGRATSHVYRATGTYLVGLTVRDDRGASATVNTIVEVEPPEGADISRVVTMSWGDRSVWRTEPVFFYAYVNSHFDATIVRYTWDFGDGSPMVDGVTARHSYHTAGSYTVRLAFVDERGRTGLLQGTITVDEPWAGASLGGVIVVPAGNSRDVDVNSVGRPYGEPSNDSFATAQREVAPAAIGGTVNLAGMGPAGELREVGDPADFFRFTLRAGERVRLEFDPASPADLDLYLFDAEADLVDASVSNTGREEVVAPADGEYVIEVRCEQGAAIYRLSVGSIVASLASGSTLRLGEAFLSGRALRLHAAVPEQTPPGGLARGQRGRPVERLMLAPGELRAGRVEATLRDRGIRPASGQIGKLATLLRIKQMQRAAPSALIEPEFIRRPLATFADPFYPAQWNLRAIDVPEAWDFAVSQGLSLGAESIVAVIDSGVLLDHPDLAGGLVPGYDFVADPEMAADGDGIDPDPTDTSATAIDFFHGTHVAGVIAARRDNYEGGVGVAPQALVMPVRALGADGGTSYDLAQAIRFAAGLANDSGSVPARRADIINLSLGSDGFSAVEAAAVQDARAAGAILVAAAGNDGTATPSYPASYPGVLSIGASGPWPIGWGPNTDYSNFGPELDALAPGGVLAHDANEDDVPDGILGPDADVSSGTLEYGYSLAEGTSFAAAHVSGMLALMRAADPALSELDVRTMLATGLLTSGFTNQRSDTAGYGVVNARKAVSAALRLTMWDGSGSGLVASPAAFDFEYFGREVDIDLSRSGNAQVLVYAAETDAAWAQLVPRRLDGFGLGTYRLVVNRFDLLPGSYEANAIFRSAAGELRIPIRLDVHDSPPLARADTHYVLLVDADAGAIVDWMESRPRDASSIQEYSFDPLGAGRYLLIASTDYNRNGILCEVGEACGIYPQPETAQTIDVGLFPVLREFTSDHRFYLGETVRALFPDGIRVP